MTSLVFSFSITSFAQEQQASTITDSSNKDNYQLTEQEAKAKKILEQIKSEMAQAKKNQALFIRNDIAQNNSNQEKKDLDLLNQLKEYATSNNKSKETTSDIELLANKELINQFTSYAIENGLVIYV